MGNFKKRQYLHISFIFIYNKLHLGTTKIKKKLCTRTYSRNITHSLQILKLRLAYLIACHCMLQCLLNYQVLLEHLFSFWCHFSTCPFSWTGVTHYYLLHALEEVFWELTHLLECSKLHT